MWPYSLACSFWRTSSRSVMIFSFFRGTATDGDCGLDSDPELEVEPELEPELELEFDSD